MDIAIIGSGNVGGNLARRFQNVDHKVTLGVRDNSSEANKNFEDLGIKISTIWDAVANNDVVIVAIPAFAVPEFAKKYGNFDGKILVDTTNSVFKKPEPYANSFEALKDLTRGRLVKGFNSTGAENMANPKFGEQQADMFVASSDTEAKELIIKLSDDIGFCTYDFGADSKVQLLEELCKIWINLAIDQNLGRNIAFKLLKR